MRLRPGPFGLVSFGAKQEQAIGERLDPIADLECERGATVLGGGANEGLERVAAPSSVIRIRRIQSSHGRAFDSTALSITVSPAPRSMAFHSTARYARMCDGSRRRSTR